MAKYLHFLDMSTLLFLFSCFCLFTSVFNILYNTLDQYNSSASPQTVTDEIGMPRNLNPGEWDCSSIIKHVLTMYMALASFPAPKKKKKQ